MQVCGRNRGIVCFEWRQIVCRAITLILSTSLIAQEPARAILHNDGGVLPNSQPAPNASASFLHDVVQTQKGSFAKIDAQGSTVTIQPETVVRFEGEELILEHGSLQVNTSTAMRVRVDCVTVVPLTDEWTRYDVTDVDGKALGVADQNDVKIHYQGTSSHGSKQARFSDVTLHQGEQ